MKKLTMIVVVAVVVGMLVVPALAFGGLGMGKGMGPGMMNGGNRANGSQLTEEEHTKWLDEQVASGWMTQKQADYMKEMYSKRLNGYTEEEYFAWIDQQVNDGWMSLKQAEYLKELFNLNKERFGDDALKMMRPGMAGCPMQGQMGGMMGGRGMMRGGRR